MINFDTPATMRAMVLEHPKSPLVPWTVATPTPAEGQVLVKVIACGVCRTDLHIMDGELDKPKLPLIPGHEITGMVVKTGENVTRFKEGDLVGIPWLAHTCGQCKYCRKKQENLCENALFTGYSIDGGYAEYTVAYADFCCPLPVSYANSAGAPLLCAGLIGYRSYRMLPPDAHYIGLYGFGAAAHILIQVAIHEGKKVYAFTSKGDQEAQALAMRLGAAWAGDSQTKPPVKLDGAILFAPVGSLVPKALSDLDKGGVVVCGGIHMSDIPSFPYNALWEERVIRSVANLTRQDSHDFLALAPQVPVITETHPFSLERANEALDKLRSGKINGAAVLVI